MIANTDYVSSWKSKGLSAETIKPPATSDNSLTPVSNYHGTKTRVKIIGSCLKQPKISYTHGKALNIYIVYDLSASNSNDNDPTLTKCLFGAVTLSKIADIDKYEYSGYAIGFDRRSNFSFPGGGFGQTVLIFGADMSSSAHIDSKRKDISQQTFVGLQDVLKTSSRHVLKASSTRLQRNNFTSSKTF